MPYPYITQSDLENRISANVVRRIFDDDGDGTADAAAITRILADASAKVAGYLRTMYTLADIEASTPEEVKRITLDVAVAYLTIRNPEYFRGDGAGLLKIAVDELKALRTGESRLDVEGSPEPAENAGGLVEEGDPSLYQPDTFKPTFGWGFGDY